MADLGFILQATAKAVFMSTSGRSIGLFLGELIKHQEELREFTVALYVDCVFPRDSTLVNETLVEDVLESPGVTLHRGFRFAEWQVDADVNELVFAVSFNILGDLCHVESVVKVDLEREVGEFRPGVTTLLSERWEGADLREGLAFLDSAVQQMLRSFDAPQRLGFARRR